MRLPVWLCRYAAADSVQALPLVSTIWGVVLFGEYYRSCKRTYLLLGAMLTMFAAGEQALAGPEQPRTVLCCCLTVACCALIFVFLSLIDRRFTLAIASSESQACCLHGFQHVFSKLACLCFAAVGLLMGSAGHRQTS